MDIFDGWLDVNKGESCLGWFGVGGHLLWIRRDGSSYIFGKWGCAKYFFLWFGEDG